jgi:hypothetical protein
VDVGTKKVAVEPVEPNRVVRVSFHDFIKAGDLLAATLNVQSNAILEVKVSTWLESQKDGITLAVGFSQLPDGTSYSSRTILNAKSKEIKVVVENGGHRQRLQNLHCVRWWHRVYARLCGEGLWHTSGTSSR